MGRKNDDAHTDQDAEHAKFGVPDFFVWNKMYSNWKMKTMVHSIAYVISDLHETDAYTDWKP